MGTEDNDQLELKINTGLNKFTDVAYVEVARHVQKKKRSYLDTVVKTGKHEIVDANGTSL